MGDGQLRAPTGHATQRLTTIVLESPQLTAETRMSLRQYGFRFRGDRVGDQASISGQGVEAGVEESGFGEAAAYEDRRRRFGAVERVGSFVAHVDRDTECRGVESYIEAAPLVAFERHRGAAAPTTAPLDSDAA